MLIQVMAFFSTFYTDEAKTAKVIPTFGQNPVNCKTFPCLTFVAYSMYRNRNMLSFQLGGSRSTMHLTKLLINKN